MGRRIKITDTTLRDGHQSLWAARMPTEMMLPVARHQERSGVETVDVLGHTHVVSAVRFLREDPWERIRALSRVLRRPTLVAGLGGEVFGSFRIAPRDVRESFMSALVRNGIGLVRDSHGLLDVGSYVMNLGYAKRELGARTVAGLVFSESPVHTDELYERKAREMVARANVDMIMIKDSSGLLTPERTSSLVRAVRRGAGDRQVTLHSHCMTGMAPRVYMVGVDSGVDDVHCGIRPLALGTAQPSMAVTVRNLREAGYEVGVDDAEVKAASKWLTQQARWRGLPLGETPDYDHFHYAHQVPGGMLTNLQAQLSDAGLLDRLEETLHETARVRAELGWPTMVTPYSQFVVNQALLNVIYRERYAHVPDQVKMYVHGYYGEPLAAVEPDVLDRIVANGSPDITPERPQLEPALPSLRRQHPDADDEELLLRYMCSPADVDAMRALDGRGQENWSGVARPSQTLSALTALLAQVASMSRPGEIVVEKGRVRLGVRR